MIVELFPEDVAQSKEIIVKEMIPRKTKVMFIV